MKKFLALFLIVATALTSLAGCSENEENSDLNIYSEASYDNESRFVPEEESKEGSDSESNVSEEENSRSENSVSSENNTPLSGEFVVKDKKYTFEGNDLVIVNVENQTNKNYSVTITGTYLDKNGNVLQTETQTFDQYSAGYSGYFLFKPDMQFDKFTYEFKTKETDGPFYAKYITSKFNKLHENLCPIDELMEKGDYTKYPSIFASVSMSYSGDVTIRPFVTWCIIKEDGEIIAFFEKAPKLIPGSSFESHDDKELLQTTEEEIVWPEGWKGNIQGIPVITRIVVE